MTTKARKPRKSSAPKAEKTYSDSLATCVRASRYVSSLDKTITKFKLSNDNRIVECWSFAGESHDVQLSDECLLRVAHLPDGKVFYNLQ